MRNVSRPDGRERQAVAKGLLALSNEGLASDKNDMNYLELVSSQKSKPLSRLCLLFRRNVGAYSFRDNVKSRIKILFGGY